MNAAEREALVKDIARALARERAMRMQRMLMGEAKATTDDFAYLDARAALSAIESSKTRLVFYPEGKG